MPNLTTLFSNLILHPFSLFPEQTDTLFISTGLTLCKSRFVVSGVITCAQSASANLTLLVYQ